MWAVLRARYAHVWVECAEGGVGWGLWGLWHYFFFFFFFLSSFGGGGASKAAGSPAKMKHPASVRGTHTCAPPLTRDPHNLLLAAHRKSRGANQGEARGKAGARTKHFEPACLAAAQLQLIALPSNPKMEAAIAKMKPQHHQHCAADGLRDRRAEGD